MVSAGSYILSVVLLAILALSLGFSAVRLRRWLMPGWDGAPGRLVEAIVGVALLIWLSEILGVLQLFYAGTLVAAAVVLAVAIGLAAGRGGGPGGSGRVLGFSPGASRPSPSGSGEKQDAASARTPPASPSVPAAGEPGPGSRDGEPGPEQPFSQAEASRKPFYLQLVAVGVVAVVFAHWGLTTADALSRGIFNFDSLWYHMPFAVEMAQSHSVTGLHQTETVFTNWFYPQNSELLHAVGILLTERDTLSLCLNFGWLAVAFLAAWCIGRPYGMAPLTVIAAAVILECHTLVVREPGAAKNDIMAAALLLAAIAILINAYAGRRGVAGPRVPSRGGVPGAALGFSPADDVPLDRERGEKQDAAPRRVPHPTPPTGEGSLFFGWPIAVAGLAVGLAVGTKSTALAMAAALSLAVVVLAPTGRRWIAAGWWFLPALAGGVYWYLRNLVISGNPIPQIESLGPISLPHPEKLQSGRPDFSVAHYATDTAVWSEYFWPGLHNAFGLLWPLAIGGAIAAALLALFRGDRLLRWLGGVVLFGLLAYLFTPLSAAGADGAPEAFRINLRFAIPPLLAGLTLLPVAVFAAMKYFSSAGGGGEGCRGDAASSFSPQGGSRTAGQLRGEKPSDGPAPLPPDRTRGRLPWSLADWALLGAFVVLLVATNRADAVLRDPDRLFGWAIALLFVLIPAALLYARSRGVSRGVVAGGFVSLALLVALLGYPVQRDYLEDRYANASEETTIPRMHLNSAYRWARDVDDARIGLAGTTAGFLQYGFYGADLSNQVRYLGVEAPHGAFNAIPTCAGFRAAVNEAELDYLVTAPLLNFIEPGEPVASPEAGWLRDELATTPIDRSGPVTVWRVKGRLNPSSCRDEERVVPQQPE